MATRKRKVSTTTATDTKEPVQKKSKTTGGESKDAKVVPDPEDVEHARKYWAEAALGDLRISVIYKEKGAEGDPKLDLLTDPVIQADSTGATTVTFEGEIFMSPNSSASVAVEATGGGFSWVVDGPANNASGTAPGLQEFTQQTNWTVERRLSSLETNVVFELRFERAKLSSGKIILNKVQLTLPADLVYKGKAGAGAGSSSSSAAESKAAGAEKKDDSDWALVNTTDEYGMRSRYLVPNNEETKKFAALHNKMSADEELTAEEEDWLDGTTQQWDIKYAVTRETVSKWTGKRISVEHDLCAL